MRKEHKDIESKSKQGGASTASNGSHGDTPANGDALRDQTPPPSPPSVNVGTEVEVVRLRLEPLNSAGHVYQRDINPDHIERLVANWSWPKCGVPFVNQRPDGSYWIVDGQHRVEAMREKFGNIEWWFYLTHVEGLNEEGEIFLAVNDTDKPKAVVKFRGRLHRGEPVAVDIDRIVRSAEFSLLLHGRKSDPSQFDHTSSLEAAYKTGGAAHLASVVQFLKRTWWGQPHFIAPYMVDGVSYFFATFGGDKHFNPEKASDLFSPITPKEVKKKMNARIGSHGEHRKLAWAFAMQDEYNRNVPAKERIYVPQDPKLRRRKKS